MAASLLLVDDDPMILESAKDILEDAGYHVDVMSTVQSTIEHLKSNAPAIMLVDLNLPDGNGLELARAAVVLRPALKVILMTGEEKVDLTRAAGAISVSLVKPVSPPQLLTLLKQLLQSA